MSLKSGTHKYERESMNEEYWGNHINRKTKNGNKWESKKYYKTKEVSDKYSHPIATATPPKPK